MPKGLTRVPATIVALLIVVLLSSWQFSTVIGERTLSTGLGTESFAENFGWPLVAVTRTVDRTFNPRDFISHSKGAKAYTVTHDSTEKNYWHVVLNVATITSLAVLSYVAIWTVALATSHEFVNLALLLMVIPFLAFPMLHPSGNFAELVPSSLDQFLQIQFSQVESTVVSLVLFAYILFESRPKNWGIWALLVLIAHAFIGYFLIVVRSEGGLRW
ncbi:MAG: hypothetical protein Q8M16_13215 [Pirellulaceae bacterium]|nr:hypothetical protein [Pirellulaceae bacterium]